MGWWLAFCVLAVLRAHRLVGWSWWWVVTPLFAQTVFVGVGRALGFGGPLGPAVALLQLVPGVVAWAVVFNLGGHAIQAELRPLRRPIEKLGTAISVSVHLFFVGAFFLAVLGVQEQPANGATGDLVVGGLTLAFLLGVFHALSAGVRHVYRRAHEPKASSRPL
jgi:hypothetical protein